MFDQTQKCTRRQQVLKPLQSQRKIRKENIKPSLIGLLSIRQAFFFTQDSVDGHTWNLESVRVHQMMKKHVNSLHFSQYNKARDFL